MAVKQRADGKMPAPTRREANMYCRRLFWLHATLSPDFTATQAFLAIGAAPPTCEPRPCDQSSQPVKECVSRTKPPRCAPQITKPRRAAPTGVDGGQIALAIGYGGKSWMSPTPRCKRLHLRFTGYRSNCSLTGDASLHETHLKITPVRICNQVPTTSCSMAFPNHGWESDTRPANRGFCHASGRLLATDGANRAARARAPSLLAQTLGKLDEQVQHHIQYTDMLF